ncbi:uncharacterized protein LOC141655884 [Silene latifolia]|uniref:uncharacterized protein LOC141655884 n=1 Tax=Silene latifolia TaxID=37657 RepID=UPI003D775BEF
MAHEKDYAGMENSGEQSGEEAPMYSDSYLLPILQELDKSKSYLQFAGYSWLEVAEEFIKRATGTIEQGSKDALLEGRKGTDITQYMNCDLFGRLFSDFSQVILLLLDKLK